MSNAARQRTTVLEQHCHRGLASVIQVNRTWLLERVIFLSIFTFEHILCSLLSLIYPAVYLLNKDFCELSVRLYST